MRGAPDLGRPGARALLAFATVRLIELDLTAAASDPLPRHGGQAARSPDPPARGLRYRPTELGFGSSPRRAIVIPRLPRGACRARARSSSGTSPLAPSTVSACWTSDRTRARASGPRSASASSSRRNGGNHMEPADQSPAGRMVARAAVASEGGPGDGRSQRSTQTPECNRRRVAILETAAQSGERRHRLGDHGVRRGAALILFRPIGPPGEPATTRVRAPPPCPSSRRGRAWRCAGVCGRRGSRRRSRRRAPRR